MKKFTQIAMLLSAVLWLSACSEQKSPASAIAVPTPVSVPAPAGRNLDAVAVLRGGEVYKANCAVCHGANAEGAPNWHVRGPDGKLPPPPLDASGHAWHHPGAWIRDTIKQGSVARGGNMPAWAGKLSDDDVAAVIAWIQSRWPEEIYQSWLAMDEKARKGGGAH